MGFHRHWIFGPDGGPGPLKNEKATHTSEHAESSEVTKLLSNPQSAIRISLYISFPPPPSPLLVPQLPFVSAPIGDRLNWQVVSYLASSKVDHTYFRTVWGGVFGSLVISVNDAASSVLGEEAAGKGNKIKKIVPGRKGLMEEMRARESKHTGFRSEYWVMWIGTFTLSDIYWVWLEAQTLC